MKLRDKNAALLLVDIQKGFDDEDYWGGNRNNKNAEEIAAQILEQWRTYNLPVFHIRHSSQDPNSRLHSTHEGFDFHELVRPNAGEVSMTKDVNSAFIGTDLRRLLDDQKITTVVIVGLTTNHCISTTTRMAGNYGYETYLIEDATATFDRKGINGEVYDANIIHQTTLANLNEEFATILSSSQLLAQL